MSTDSSTQTHSPESIQADSEQETKLAHHALAQQTRQLIDFCVQNNAPTDVLEAATQKLREINQLLQPHHNQHSGEPRPFRNFNFALAQSNPQDILPYSPVTGEMNPIAPPVAVRFDKDAGKLIATVTCGQAYEGPPNCIHGAVIAGIYDQILAMASACCEMAGPTAYLNTTFKRPTPLHSELTFTAWIDKTDGRKVTIKGQCELDGHILSEAEALCIQHVG